MGWAQVESLAGIVAVHENAVRIVELVTDSHRSLRSCQGIRPDDQSERFFHLWCERAEEVAVLYDQLAESLPGRNLTALKVAKANTDIPVLNSAISDGSGQLAHEWALRLAQLWLEDMWERLSTFSELLAANDVSLTGRENAWRTPSVWRDAAVILSTKSSIWLDQEAASQFEVHDLLMRTLDGIPEGILEIIGDEFRAAVKLLSQGDGGSKQPVPPVGANLDGQDLLQPRPLSLAAEFATAHKQITCELRDQSVPPVGEQSLTVASSPVTASAQPTGAVEQQVDGGQYRSNASAPVTPQAGRSPRTVADRRRKIKFEQLPPLVKLFKTRKGLLEKWKAFLEQPRSKGQAIGYRDFAVAWGCESSERHLPRLIDSEIRFQRRNGYSS